MDQATKRVLVQQARTFRKQPTPAEAALWERVRAQQLAGLRVRRQQPISPFVVDFFVPAAKLVVEIDGSVHDDADAHARDLERQRQLEATGLRVVRFRNAEVLRDVEGVVARIEAALTPKPLSQLRERGAKK